MSMEYTILGDVPASEIAGWKLLIHYFEPLIPFYRDPSVTEIMVNRYDTIFVERHGKLERVDATFGSERSLQELIFQVGNRLNQIVDDDHPILHARFPDCSRLCCTLPTITPGGATMALRVAPKITLTFGDLVKLGALSAEMVDYLGEKIRRAANMLISGNTGSGKTSILRAAAQFIDKDERVITGEDTQELYLGNFLPGTIAMEAPKRRTDNPVTLATLIETMLRQRPDRGWVGEIRDAAAANAFLQLINTGHTGCATSLHANSCADAIERIQYLLASAGLMNYDLAGRQVKSSLQLMIHASRDYRYGRKIREICEVRKGEVVPVFRLNEETMEHERVG